MSPLLHAGANTEGYYQLRRRPRQQPGRGLVVPPSLGPALSPRREQQDCSNLGPSPSSRPGKGPTVQGWQRASSFL